MLVGLWFCKTALDGARRPVGRGTTRVFSDVRLPVGGDPGGVGSSHAGPAYCRRLAGLRAAPILEWRSGGWGVVVPPGGGLFRRRMRRVVSWWRFMYFRG